MDVDAAAIDAAMREAGATLMVHGHTHRPGIHALADGRRRIVLGGWKLQLKHGDAALCRFALL